MMTPGLDERLARVLAKLKEMGDVKAIYLFGSRAAGRATPFSDVDLCVVTRPALGKNKRTDIASFSDDSIDISLFWELPVAMRYRILKEGRPLFQRSGSYMKSVTLRTLREYLDFKPVIRRFAEAAGVFYE